MRHSRLWKIKESKKKKEVLTILSYGCSVSFNYDIGSTRQRSLSSFTLYKQYERLLRIVSKGSVINKGLSRKEEDRDL